MTEAVIFDLDGVLLDSEGLWDRARREVVDQQGGQWRQGATAAMQGMSSGEWAQYLQEVLGVDLAQDRIIDMVVDRLLASYRDDLPLMPGAKEVLERFGDRWPLGLASSSNRAVIDRVLVTAGWQSAFEATVSSEEVHRGKPAPDVYLEAARRLGRSPLRCVAIEDSTHGIQAGVAAGLQVVAVPDRRSPPSPAVLATATRVVDSLDDLAVAMVEDLDGGSNRALEQRLDEAEAESFPASDSHSDWAGPPD